MPCWRDSSLQRAYDVLRILKAHGRILLEATRDDALEEVRHVLPDASKALRRAGKPLHQNASSEYRLGEGLIGWIAPHGGRIAPAIVGYGIVLGTMAPYWVEWPLLFKDGYGAGVWVVGWIFCVQGIGHMVGSDGGAINLTTLPSTSRLSGVMT